MFFQQWDFGSIIGPHVIVAHEMGHNFGMNHDRGIPPNSLLTFVTGVENTARSWELQEQIEATKIPNFCSIF